MISPDEAIKRLPRALRRARKEAGLDVETAATRAGVSTLTIGNHESGTHRPSIESLFQLLAAYGIGLSEFQVLLLDTRREEEFDRLKKRVRSLERKLQVVSQ